jgi:hypothetical protein
MKRPYRTRFTQPRRPNRRRKRTRFVMQILTAGVFEGGRWMPLTDQERIQERIRAASLGSGESRMGNREAAVRGRELREAEDEK